MSELSELTGVVAEMVANPGEWRERLEAVRDEMQYFPGRGAERAGRYVLGLVLEAQAAREGDEAGVEAARAERAELLADDVMLPRLKMGE